MKVEMGSNIVVWSGGADSTWVLHHYAGVSSEDYPVRALSIASHPYLSKPFMKAQAVARNNYLALAKKRGYHIKYEKMTVGGNWIWKKPPDSFEHNTAQPLMWLSALSQAVGDGDSVLMGYIRGDCFWHTRSEFEKAFKAICELKGVNATLKYPVEYDSKASVLLKLKKAKVPASCWFSCEDTKDGTPCNECVCCDEIKAAKASWEYKKVGFHLSTGKTIVK